MTTVETDRAGVCAAKSKKSANPPDSPKMNKEHQPKKNADDGLKKKVAKDAESIEEKIKKTAGDLADKGRNSTAGEEKTATKAAEKTVKIAESELSRLKDELAEAKDRALRSLAELENFRQRKNREMADDRKYAAMDLARDILPVWDNMGRAIEAAEKDLNAATLIDGVKMMHKQFLDIFQKYHIEKIDALGKPFDPNFHESIAMLPSDEPAGNVIVDSQAGFTLHDRVVRPTQVVVSAAKPAAKP